MRPPRLAPQLPPCRDSGSLSTCPRFRRPAPDPEPFGLSGSSVPRLSLRPAKAREKAVREKALSPSVHLSVRKLSNHGVGPRITMKLDRDGTQASRPASIRNNGHLPD